MRKLFALMFLTVTAFTACNDDDDDKKTEESLYNRLGKVEAISAVVDQFLSNVVADERINDRFAATVAEQSRVTALRNNLIDQICQGTGGPCTYTGKSMMEAHEGMNISDAEFNALVEDLVAALNKFEVGEQEKNELLGILGPMKTDIVGQ